MLFFYVPWTFFLLPTDWNIVVRPKNKFFFRRKIFRINIFQLSNWFFLHYLKLPKRFFFQIIHVADLQSVLSTPAYYESMFFSGIGGRLIACWILCKTCFSYKSLNTLNHFLTILAVILKNKVFFLIYLGFSDECFFCCKFPPWNKFFWENFSAKIGLFQLFQQAKC